MRHLLYSFLQSDDEEAKHEPVDWLRLTIGQCNVVDLARYRKLRREAGEWFFVEHGIRPEDLPDDADEELTQTLYSALGRAHMLAALKRIEWAQVEPGVEPDDWKTSDLRTELPAEWQTVRGFVFDMPAGLFIEWDRLAHLENPGLWYRAARSDDEKKTGQTYVTSLTKR